MFLFVVYSFSLLCFSYKKKIEKSEKYKNSVYFVYISTCVPWMALKQIFLNFVSFVA